MNLRSGDPGDVATASWTATVTDAQHTVTGVALNYQYVSGYGGDGAPGGATFELLALAPGPCGAGGAVIATLYTSPVLDHYPYDSCNTCYSPPQNVSVSSLNLNATGGVVFAMRFTDNQRNVQIKLPLPITIFWSS